MNDLDRRCARFAGQASTPIALAAAALALLAGCDHADDVQSVFEANACARVSVIDDNTGAAIIGAEDLAPDFVNGRVYMSAYDRRAVERAVKKRADAIPQGGVYEIGLADLASGASVISARALVMNGTVSGGLRPHGIDYDPVRREISFINRAYFREGRAWKMTPQIEKTNIAGAVYVGAAVAPPCAANDVVAIGDKMLVTYDHASCGVGGLIENVFGLKRSGVATAGGKKVFSRALFANGIARGKDGRLVLAATREKALLVLQKENGGWRSARRIKVPGAPDNLTASRRGKIISAVHPSLMRIWMHRKLGRARAPSRIIETDLATGKSRILFDDPSGEIYSAATVALLSDGLMVLGSVTDEGLLVCQKPAPGL